MVVGKTSQVMKNHFGRNICVAQTVVYHIHLSDLGREFSN